MTAPTVAEKRKAHFEALGRERAFVEVHEKDSPEKATRLSEIDAELDKYSDEPKVSTRSRETRS